jgi:hypothetical protein
MKIFVNMHFSPNIMRMIKSRRMGWKGHVARMERRGIRTGIWILGKWNRAIWTGFVWLGIGPTSGLLRTQN